MTTDPAGPVSKIDRPGDGLTARQRRAVMVVLTAPTLGEAARLVGVSPRTLYRWRSSEPFTRSVRATARALDRDAADQLRAATVDAVRVLREALADEAPAVRVRAAVALLDAAERARDDDVSERLQALERRLLGEDR